ncbi:carbohydrate esterase family 2 protein [Piromyces sp. E2]|nr:carbohydrate esterase family 2 protein [Piromyces sp. E2]|eukprot:OUM64776.1 carbohydrate esterase family 2 protein [Piromyces sp. E2]
MKLNLYLLIIAVFSVVSTLAKKTTKLYSFEPTKHNVKILGRANYQNGYLWFGLTDTGIEYTFYGKTTVINVTADTKAYSEESPAHIAIYADGKIYEKTLINQKNTDFTVKFNRKGKHTVTFIKISEAEQGSLRINKIKADVKKIIPTPPNKKKIEFIGDSITCAYGVDGKETDTYSTATQDGTKSYAYLTAKKFNADYSIVAYSGYAILSAVSFDGERNPNTALPPYYDKLGLTFGSEFFSLGNNEFDDGTYELQSTTWKGYKKYNPDLIVINLGTNDSFYFFTIDPSKVEAETEVFVKKYEEFLTKLRRKYPRTEILCTYGIMGQYITADIEKAINNYIAKTGDKRVHTYIFNEQNAEKNGMGADTHPNAQSQLDSAHELINEIERLYGWKADKKVNIDKLI